MKRISSIQHDRLNAKEYFLLVLLFIFLGGQEGFAAGWVDVNSGVNVSPSPVTVGKNFDVSFSLKEYKGESKSFEYIQLWIQDGSGNDLFDAETWNNVSFSPWQQRNFSVTTFLDPAWGRKPGSYRAIVRGKVAGDVPFNFGIVSGSGGGNPRSFSATPIIAQGPMSGPPGTTFTQWGEGFTANSTATLHFKKSDGSEYPTQDQAMDSSGHFETQYTAPTDKEPGQYTWWAVDGPTGISSNQVTYTIEEPPVDPAVAQSPMSGPPGTTFTQWGTGFTPNSTATLHFKKPDGSEYPTQDQAMDSSGHFETQYTAPTDKEPGQYTWWAVDGPTGISSNQVTYTIEEPPVDPAVAQSPMSGPPGTTFTQWGTGFTPNSTATLHFKKPDGSEYPTQDQAMDSSGHFETQYTAPTDKEPGQYTWWAVDGTTGISSNQVTYTITDSPVPTIAQLPMTASQGMTLAQWGTNFTPNGVATLHFQKPDGTEFDPVVESLDADGHFDISYELPSDRTPGNYTWWAVDNATGAESNHVSYSVIESARTPQIDQSPRHGIVGDTFARWGSGFTPSGNVNVFEFVNSNWEMLKQIQAEADGSFTDEYTVPTNTEVGIHYWRAIDEATSTQSDQFEYTITSVRLHPQIEQDRNSVLPNDVPILHSGEGFTPSSGVTMHIRQPDLSEITLQSSTDQFGNFSMSRSIPADALIGSYQWWVIDDSTLVKSNTLTYSILTTSNNPVLEIHVLSRLDLYRPDFPNSYTIEVSNTGNQDINNATIEITYDDSLANIISYCIAGNSCSLESGPTDNSILFNVSVETGASSQAIIKLRGKLSEHATSVSVTATVSGGIPTVSSNSDVHTLEAFPSDLPGTQESELFVRSLDGLSKARPTVVLTHGLQPLNSEKCEPEIGLWTGNLQRIPQASSLLKGFSLLENPEMNVLQFFWKGACQKHGLMDTMDNLPTASAYIKGRQNVYYAGRQLAVKLEKLLGKGYQKPIQFIGHSLGTAVNAYAARIFLEKATGIPEAQVTILDYPNNVSKIPFMTDEDERLYGFDDNFFAKVLPVTGAIPLYIDNYYADWTGIINTKFENFGVGSQINFPKPIVEQELKDSHEMNDYFFDEGFDNDHSGVHQWYRWTMKPYSDKHLTGNSVCTGGVWSGMPIADDPPEDDEDEKTLDPCKLGWNISILKVGGDNFPFKSVNSPDNSIAVDSEFGTGEGTNCHVHVSDSEIICQVNRVTTLQDLSVNSYSTESIESTEGMASLNSEVNIPNHVRYITFDYRFSQQVKGDVAHLLVGGRSIWKMGGEATDSGIWNESGPIVLRMEEGDNILTVYLDSESSSNMVFEIRNLKFLHAFDTDGDGYADDDDYFPDDPAEWEDTDEDGIGNNADLDDDNDGFQDTEDTFPLDPDENADTDGDGIGDNADLDDGMYPDHAVISSAVDKAQLAPGENFTYSATVKNQGTGRARTTTLRYYRSTDATVDSNDTPLGTDTVGTLNAGHTSPENISLTAPSTPGTYWLGSCVDPVNGDSNADNNCGTAVQITVASGQPDLLVSGIGSPSDVEAGELFHISAWFKNQGTLDATPVTANIYYMNPATGSTSEAVHQMDVPALAVNETVSESASVQAPCEAGDYALAVCINPGMNVESNSNNNCLLKSLSVSGDCPQSAFLPAINLLLLNGQE